jgi:hypothetical protein
MSVTPLVDWGDCARRGRRTGHAGAVEANAWLEVVNCGKSLRMANNGRSKGKEGPICIIAIHGAGRGGEAAYLCCTQCILCNAPSRLHTAGPSQCSRPMPAPAHPTPRARRLSHPTAQQSSAAPEETPSRSPKGPSSPPPAFRHPRRSCILAWSPRASGRPPTAYGVPKR